jgi:ribosome-binding factor A
MRTAQCARASAMENLLNHSKRLRRGYTPPVDPAFAFALDESSDTGRSSNRHEQYKTLQLCAQVQHALNLALADRYTDDAMGELFVDAVRPAPDCRHLLVEVLVPSGCPVTEVLGRLRSDAGYLRSRVAMAITRKRAPELSFVPLVGMGRPR